MKSFQELIRNRRSVRKFNNKNLGPESVATILKAALAAPSGRNRRATQFLLVEEKEKLKALSMLKETGAAFIAEAPFAVVVMGSPMLATRWYEDACIAATYMQLQAEDLGIGSCWVQVYDALTPNGQESTQYVRNLFNIPYQLEVLCVIAMGHYDERPEPRSDEELRFENLFVGAYPDIETE